MLNARLLEAAEAFASLDPDHSGDPDELRVKWYYDQADDTFQLELASSHEENTSCSCHPYYTTVHHYSSHTIPASEIAPPLDLIDVDGVSLIEGDLFQPHSMPCYAARKAAIEAAREAKQKADAEANLRAREREEKLLRERKEQEFERLKRELGK